MYKELNPASQASIELNDFVIAYREAEQVATLRALEPGSAHDPSSRDGETVVPVPIAVTTVAFGRFEDEVDLPYADGGIDWDPSLVFPGLRQGEHLESEIELAPRAPILAADGSPLAEGPAERTRTPARQRRDRRHRRSRRSRRRRPGRSSPATASPPTPRSASAASSAPSTPASPASPGGSLLAVDETRRPRSACSPRPNRSRGRR